MSMVKIFTIFGTILLFLSFFSGCVQNSIPLNSTTPNSTTQNPTTQDNSPITVTINSAHKTTEINGVTPKPGTVFVIVNLTIENRGDKDYTFNEKAVSMSAGTTVDENLYTKITGHKYWGAIPSHEKRTGEIIFGTGNSTQNYTLTFFYHNHQDSFTQELGTIPTGDSSSSPGTLHDQPLKEPVSLTIHSAEKLKSVNKSGFIQYPMSGHIFLLLNITLKNNDNPEGFVFEESSLNLLDLKGGEFVNHPLNSGKNMRENLDKPLVPSTNIEQNEFLNGQIIFGIADSTDYRLNLLDNDNRVILSKNIHLD
jgi:hypothetical protein